MEDLRSMFQIHGKLYLHRHTHLTLRDSQNLLENLRQRESIMVQYVVESQHSVAVFQYVVVQVAGAVVVSGRNQSEPLVLLGFRNRTLLQVEAVIHFRMEIGS